jgi:hypothetical protein
MHDAATAPIDPLRLVAKILTVSRPLGCRLLKKRTQLGANYHLNLIKACLMLPSDEWGLHGLERLADWVAH